MSNIFVTKYLDELIARRMEFERVINCIKRGGLLQLLERDLELLRSEMKNMLPDEKEEIISLIVEYGTEHLRSCGYDSNRIQKINEKVRNNLHALLSGTLKVSMADIYKYSVKSWEASELQLKELKEKEAEKSRRTREILERCKNFAIGGAMAVVDSKNYQAMGHGAAISILCSFGFLWDAVVKPVK